MSCSLCDTIAHSTMSSLIDDVTSDRNFSGGRSYHYGELQGVILLVDTGTYERVVLEIFICILESLLSTFEYIKGISIYF